MKKAYKRFAILTISAALAGVVALGACSLGGQTGGDDTDPDDPAIDNNDPTPEPEEKYSQILQDVLESDYYAELTDMYEAAWNYPITKAHEAIPYAFLSREGFDIQAIKDEEIDCDSVAYIKNEDTSTLYLSTKVVTDGADPYYTCYTLSYPLTDKEYDDLVMLHQEKYIQAPYFIQELDNQKTAEVISKASITVEAYDELLQAFIDNEMYSTEVFGLNDIEMDFLDFNVNDNTFEVNLRTWPYRGNNTSTMVMIVRNGQLRNLHLVPALSVAPVSTLSYNSSVFIRPTYYWNPTNLTEFQNNYDSLTYFDSSAMYNLHLGTDL